VNRRDFLVLSVAPLLHQLQADEELVDFADLANFKTDLRLAYPRIKCFDLRQLTSWRTPNDQFFAFHQTLTQYLDAGAWRLRISGFVEEPLEFTLDQLKARPEKRELPFTIECSGNAPGPAANGLVSNGVWTGVGLSRILEEARPRPEAREVVFFGTDLEQERNSNYEAPHGRSLYVKDAMHPDAILAYELNGKPLSAEQGFPLRLIVPGWYGMAQIKWLDWIEVLDRRYEGANMSRNYHTMNSIQTASGELFLETSISRTKLNSVVARVTRRMVGGKFEYKVAGAAWGGPNPIKAVEVRVDDGPWVEAVLDSQREKYAWTLWSYDWKDPAAGEHTLVSRAVDSGGAVQPTVEEFQKSVKSAREDNSQWVRRIRISV